MRYTHKYNVALTQMFAASFKGVKGGTRKSDVLYERVWLLVIKYVGKLNNCIICVSRCLIYISKFYNPDYSSFL